MRPAAFLPVFFNASWTLANGDTSETILYLLPISSIHSFLHHPMKRALNIVVLEQLRTQLKPEINQRFK